MNGLGKHSLIKGMYNQLLGLALRVMNWFLIAFFGSNDSATPG